MTVYPWGSSQHQKGWRALSEQVDERRPQLSLWEEKKKCGAGAEAEWTAAVRTGHFTRSRLFVDKTAARLFFFRPLFLFFPSFAYMSLFLAIFPFKPSEQQLKMEWNSSSISNGKPKINRRLIMKVAATRSSQLWVEGLSKHAWENCLLSLQRCSSSLHLSFCFFFLLTLPLVLSRRGD